MEEKLTTLQTFINTAVEFLVNYSFQIIGALIIIVAGVLASNWASNFLFKTFQKNNLDITLSKFLAGVIKVLLLSFVFLIALGNFGITIAPFIAALGALSFGASMAIQGPLSNYGAGVSIIMSRPFVVGDTITVCGVSGLVKEVKLACTTLTDEDGIKITIPNKQIVGEILHNSSVNRIVEATIGIKYENDPETAIRVIRETLGRFPEVVKQPAAQVGLQEWGDSSLDIGLRYWIPTSKYFQTLYAVNLALHKDLAAAGIEMPYPQREVRILSQPQNSPSSFNR
ncbi:MAG TPA: mechanosensitive ion channel family protein [Verrucomicrobiae bacterium]|jgi:small conductance mechanosensitive channel|nr:mechanosensitive ion channel family protein [Verrucomicrobiae bacterium]